MNKNNRPAILIADDDDAVRESLKLVLSEKYKIFTATDGQEALEKAKSIHPDMVLLDIKMPKANGLQALKELKKIDANLPVIIITGYNSVEIAIEAIKLGACDYILKPFPKEQVLNAIEKGLKPVR